MGTGSLTQLWEQLGQDIDGEAAGDYSGFSVSLSADGSRVAIGAPLNDQDGSASGNAGKTRVYELDNNVWTKLGEDIDGEEANERSGYSVSLSADGTKVAIGALQPDPAAIESGHTRIYQYNGTTKAWTQLGEDIDGGVREKLESGISVSLSADGSRVAIGADFNDPTGGGIGHTRIFEYNGTKWVQLGEDIDGEAFGDESGFSVSLSADGSRVAIGAKFNSGGGGNSGHTRIFKYNGTKWVQLGEDIDGEAENDRSGISVSLSADGSRVAIGAKFNSGGGGNSGHTRIFKYNGDQWEQLGQDIDGEAENDRSGISVSLSADGTRVAIGAYFNSGGGGNSGHTRIFKYNGDQWEQLGQDIDGEAAGDYSGFSVSLSADGSSVAIGADYNDGGGELSGHTRIFELVTR